MKFKKKRYIVTYEETNTSRRTTVKKNAIIDIDPEKWFNGLQTENIIVITFIFEL